MLKKLVVPVVAVVVVLVGAFWWFVLRDDAPDKLSVGSGSSTTIGETPESLDGSWAVGPDSGSTAGFRITESFAGGLTDHEAVGRSTGVTGSFTIEGTTVTTGQFTVDLTQLEFTDDPGLPVANRVRALQDRGLQTSEFPEASFELTEPIDFGAEPEAGKTIDATATGELTLHGVTNEITFPVQAVLNGNTIQIGTNPDDLPEVVLADYDIEAPTTQMVASVSDTGTFEFLVTVTQL
ncbi:MAG: YceI family protein [Acidimicrobiales bacterium]|nr:YceI family protein [Acidimicrobiales bacterium]